MASELNLSKEEQKGVECSLCSFISVHEVQCNLSNESFETVPDTVVRSHENVGTDPPPPGIANWVVKPTLTMETQTLETGDNWYYDNIQPRKKCCHPKASDNESQEDLQCCFIIATNLKKMEMYSELPRQYFGYDPSKADQDPSEDNIQEKVNTNTDNTSPKIPEEKKPSLTSILYSEKPIILNDKEILAKETERIGKDMPRQHKFDIDDIRTRDLYGTTILTNTLPRKKLVPSTSFASIQKSVQMFTSEVQMDGKKLGESSSEDIIPEDKASKSNIKILLQSIDNTDDSDDSDDFKSVKDKPISPSTATIGKSSMKKP